MKKVLLKPVNPDNPYMKAYIEAVEKGMKNPHVIPVENKWVVKTFSSSKPFDITENRGKALTSAYVLARSTGSDAVFVHSRDGGITRKTVPAR